MKSTSVKLNKIASVFIESNGFTTIKSMTKAKFFQECAKFDSLEIHCGIAINATINKLKSAGFTVVVDDSFGFEWECKLFCKK